MKIWLGILTVFNLGVFWVLGNIYERLALYQEVLEKLIEGS